jgi:hypothetical protein
LDLLKIQASILPALEIIAIVGIVYFLFFLLTTKISNIKNKVFQNLNNFVLSSAITIVLISTGLSWWLQDEETILMVLGICGILMFVALSRNGFISLDDSIEEVFDTDYGWWDKFWGNNKRVDSKFLDRKTYGSQAIKIKHELRKRSIKSDIASKVDIELSHTLNIIDNVDEIFRKSRKGETTMLNNKGLLHKSYNELVNRYDFFEQQYHALLQENYDLKHDISKTVSKNKTAEEQKDLLKNL